MKNLIRTAFAAVLLMSSFSSLLAEDVWPPIRPWTDPWGDTRIWINPWDDTIVWWWDKGEDDDFYI